MAAFLALTWNGCDPQADGEAQALQAHVTADGTWTPLHADRDVRVWARGACRPCVRQDGDIVVIGTCLAQGGTHRYRLPDVPPDTSVDAVARRFSDEAWGAYVALFGTGAVFRDPSGAMDCLTWPIGRVRVITSDAGWPPAGLLPPRCALDWRVIAQWCQDSGSGSAQAGLAGVEVVGSGSLLDWSRGEPVSRLIWRPSRFAARSAPPAREIGEGLRQVVGLAAEGLVQGHDRVLQEISGGLDSAVVAAALVQRGLAPRVSGALNYYGDRPEGDERAYAVAIADRLGLPLTCVAKPMEPLTQADFVDAAKGLRPGFATVDPVRDRDTAERLRSSGSTGLVTGHGGDVVFFQMPTLLIAADRLQLRGLSGLSIGFIEDVARLTHQSAWSVIKAARARPDLAAHRPPTFGRADPDAAIWTDPWTADCAGVPPAKRLQVRALHRSQVAMGWSRRGLEAEIIHPLLSQPVMEFCLALTTAELTRGGRDRVVARDAYRGHLPDLVIDRRSKGDLTAHYGRILAASLDVLRPLLLEGCLVEARLLDRRRLETALSAERLILHRANSEILVAALIESWVRWWQTRVADAPQGPRPRFG